MEKIFFLQRNEPEKNKNIWGGGEKKEKFAQRNTT